MKRSILLCAVICLSAPSLQAQEKFLGKTADGWAQQLKTSSVAVQRRNAAYALGKLGKNSVFVLPDIKAAIGREKDAKARDALVYALGEICRSSPEAKADAGVETILLAALKDDAPYVRRSAAFALGCQASKSDKTRTALDAALDDTHAIVRQNAAWALGQFGVAALPSLQKALRDKDSFVKRDAAGSLLQVDDSEKVHLLVKDLLPLCRDTNSEVRRAALNVLVRVVDARDRDAIATLKWSLEDRDVENKRNAAMTLTNIGGDETAAGLNVLLEAAKNGDVELRRQSVLAIRNIGPTAFPAVKELSGILILDKDAEVRRNAALALGGIGKASEPAIPLLVQKIQDTSENPFARIECSMALARIGPVPSAVQHVPALLKVLDNNQQDPRVRERVIWALRVHAVNLREMNGPLESFTKILKEPLSGDNKMLRYDCAYMLGMIWQKEAPDATLDILKLFLEDPTIKLYENTGSSVGGTSDETKAGAGKVTERGAGDGRVMAVDALSKIGRDRYGARADIMKQLRFLSDDAKTYPPLRQKAMALVR